MSHPDSTARIRFSEWRATDHALAQQLWGDKRVTRYISMPKVGYTQTMIDNRLALEITSQQADGVQYWPMYALSGELIGVCGLQMREQRTYELGYHLRPAYWGAGYATEAARAVVHYARTKTDAVALVARHHPDNWPSKHILCDKLGFEYSHHEVYPPTGLVTPSYLLPLTHPQPTARLHYGNWQAGQLAQAQYLWGNRQVTAMISKAGFSQADIKARLAAECASQQADGVQYWPIYQADGALVGVCGLHARKVGCYELGYHLLPQFWQQGYATEAARGVIRFAQQVLQAPALIAGHNPENLASKHVLEKVGFYYTHQVVYAPTGKLSPQYRLDLG